MTAIGSRRDTRARAERAAKLRGCGYAWQAIADAEGFRSRQAAQIAVERHYAREQPAAGLSRRSLCEGLMLVKQTLFEGLADAKKSGVAASVIEHSREIRSVTDQLAKLDGLHAPQKVDVNVRHTTSELIDQYRDALLASLEDGVIDAEVVEDEPKGAIER
jgi:hypothetical protein